MLHDGKVVAEAVARAFRADLLRAGHGHGHYGFHARLRAGLPPGPCGVMLHLPATGMGAPMAVNVPRLDPPRPARVEDLLRVAPGWTVADLVARPGCLDMPGQHARLGTARFVDAVYRFALERWPSAAESRLHESGLHAGRIEPEGLLLELLTGRERADMAPDLACPYDPEFPFLNAGA